MPFADYHKTEFSIKPNGRNVRGAHFQKNFPRAPLYLPGKTLFEQLGADAAPAPFCCYGNFKKMQLAAEQVHESISKQWGSGRIVIDFGTVMAGIFNSQTLFEMGALPGMLERLPLNGQNLFDIILINGCQVPPGHGLTPFVAL
jgi:hypothetical protein